MTGSVLVSDALADGVDLILGAERERIDFHSRDNTSPSPVTISPFGAIDVGLSEDFKYKPFRHLTQRRWLQVCQIWGAWLDSIPGMAELGSRLPLADSVNIGQGVGFGESWSRAFRDRMVDENGRAIYSTLQEFWVALGKDSFDRTLNPSGITYADSVLKLKLGSGVAHVLANREFPMDLPDPSRTSNESIATPLSGFATSSNVTVSGKSFFDFTVGIDLGDPGKDATGQVNFSSLTDLTKNPLKLQNVWS